MIDSVTVFPIKPWTLEKISGMFIVSWPIRCEMKPQKITDKPQQGSVTTWFETTSWLVLLQEIFNFPFGPSKKAFFDHKLTPVTWRSVLFKKPKQPNRPKSECKLWKFYNGIGRRPWVKISQHGSKTTNHGWLADLLNCTWNKHREACDWFIFLLSDALSSCVLILSSWSVKCRFILFDGQQSLNRETKVLVFENSKN